MCKELYIAAHDELAAEMLERHPHMSETKAYDMTAEAADERMKDKLADMIDMADHGRDRMRREIT